MKMWLIMVNASFYCISEAVARKCWEPAVKYWTPGRPKDVPSPISPGRSLKITFNHLGDVPI